MENEIKTTERGWVVRTYSQSGLRFSRNTLVEFYNLKVIVSTVGRLCLLGLNEPIPLPEGGYYNTKAFIPKESSKYDHNIDINKEIVIGCKNAIDHFDEDTDNEANEMHENAVKWVCEQLKKGVEL